MKNAKERCVLCIYYIHINKYIYIYIIYIKKIINLDDNGICSVPIESMDLKKFRNSKYSNMHNYLFESRKNAKNSQYVQK